MQQSRYNNLFEREQAVLNEETERERLEDKRQERQNAKIAHQRHFDTMRSFFKQAKDARSTLDAIGNRILDTLRKTPSLADINLVGIAIRYSSLIILPTVAFVDFLFLSGVASFLLALAGIANSVLVWVSKFLLPAVLVSIEIALGFLRYDRTHTVGSIYSYILPVVVAVLAGITFLASVGITALADFSLLPGIQFVVIVVLGWIIHQSVVTAAPFVAEALSLAILEYRRRQYRSFEYETETNLEKTFNEFVYGMRAIRRARQDFDLEVDPEFHLFPDDLRTFINERLGYEVIPLGHQPDVDIDEIAIHLNNGV